MMWIGFTCFGLREANCCCGWDASVYDVYCLLIFSILKAFKHDFRICITQITCVDISRVLLKLASALAVLLDLL